MEKEFTEWFEANEKRFTHGQFDEKQIAYSAWLEGRTEALRKHAVMSSSSSKTPPPPPLDRRWKEGETPRPPKNYS